MFRKTVILFGLTLGFLGVQGQATTYYLDSKSGNDFHAGAQLSTPLQSLRYASSMLYHPGDQILLKAGSVWQGETLDISTTDESDEPIMVGSYGTGSQPILDGLNSASSPLTLSSTRNVIISNLTIQNAKTLITINGGTNNIVRNCTLRNAGTFATYMENSANFTFSNNNYATTGSFAMHGQVLHAQAISNSIKVTGNTVTLNSASGGCIGLYVIDINNPEVSGNIVHGGAEPIGIKGVHRSVTGVKVHDNQIYAPVTGSGDGEAIELTGWIHTHYTVTGAVYHNFIKGGPSTTNGIAVFQSPNVLCYNNVVIGPMRNAAIHWSSTSPGGLFYGNTIHNVRVAFAVFSGSSATIRNNVVSKAEVALSVSGAKVTEDYNIFYASGARGAAKGAHSTTANPRFVSSNPAGPLDVKLGSGSPAIHSGAKLTSSAAMALDPGSVRFPCALLSQAIYGWDRGAFGHK
ncbi:MAG: right-handed parallel beta-helix repeat-containing protein [Bryobacteraceae bacterium]